MKNEESTILIVDDEKANIQVLGNILNRYNYKIAVAHNGIDAIAIASDILPDLIMLDVMMPGIDGFETCRRLKADPILNCIPVLFITALDNAEEIINGFELGAVDYIIKPFNSKVLISRIRTHLLLRKKSEELERINATLEEKVALRTSELEAANKELQKLDEMKSEFLSIISHEIRTPLNGIMGFTELIKINFKDESINHYIEALNKSAKRLERFSVNALNFTFLKSGKYFLDLSNVNISQLIKEVIEKTQKQSNKQNVSFNFNCIDDIFVKADKKLLKTCVQSIVDNAIRFSPQDAEITISGELANNQLHIKFSDRGSGFSPKALESLFKAFSPGEQFFNENEGMELALSNLIMHAHNGHIQVRNLDSGAEVSMVFNLKQQ